MHISPIGAALIHVALNTAIFIVLYMIVRKAIVNQTKAKALAIILEKCKEIEKDIQDEIAAKPPGELGHYARIRNDIRAAEIEQLSEVAQKISRA